MMGNQNINFKNPTSLGVGVCQFLWDYYISDDVRLAILGGVEYARTYDSRSDAEKVVGKMRKKYGNVASDTTINIEEYISKRVKE